MSNISSQDFRNVYEKFYAQIRNYLWPYSVLEELANVEVDIYTSFIDLKKLSTDLDKLYRSIKDTCKDDGKLNKAYEDLRDLADNEDVEQYAALLRVTEVNPEAIKTLHVQDVAADNEEDINQ